MDSSDTAVNKDDSSEIIDPEWEKIHYSEYDPDALTNIDFSVTEQESDLEVGTAKLNKFYVGPFEPAPFDYTHFQNHHYVSDGRYLAVLFRSGARFHLSFIAFFFFGMSFIIPFLWILVSLGSWGFHFGFIPELTFVLIVSGVSFVISKFLNYYAKSLKGIWYLFDRKSGLVYLPSTQSSVVPLGTPETTIAFDKLYGVVKGLFSAYGGSTFHGMLVSAYRPKNSKYKNKHVFTSIAVESQTHDGVAGFPETYTMLCHFMDKTKPYPDSLRRMIQLYQDKGTYINGEPLKEEDVINEKLYDFKLERVINPCGIMYKYINECLENNKPVDYDRFIPNLKKSYRADYPIFKPQD